MQGVTVLVSGYVFLASLAAPALLSASEDPGTAPEEAPQAKVPDGDLSQPPASETQLDPQPEGQQGVGNGGDAAEDGGSPSPASDPGEPAGGVVQEGPPQDSRTRSRQRGGKRPTAGAAATHTVLMRNIKFNPRNITIDRGDTVRWENRDNEPHNAIARDDSFHTATFEAGGSASHTFRETGEFPYFCSIHQGMTGKVTVAGSGGGGGGGGTGSGSGATAAPRGTSGGTSSFGSTDISGRASSLPTTGHDIGWLVLAGAGLLTLGAAVRLLVARD
jgi:plastocyanin